MSDAGRRRLGFTPPRDESLWNYRALVDAFRGNPAHHPALVDELDRTVAELERLAQIGQARL